jgi:hypothetical protein
MKYKIYPSIGIARVGNSDEFFIGPETPGSLGVQINDNGKESPITSFKDGEFRVKRQAARFRLFQFPDGSSEGKPVELPEGATITWAVHLVNKKAAVSRPPGPPAEPQKPELEESKKGQLLNGGKRSVQGASASPVKFVLGALSAQPQPTYLGELRTDPHQNLIVLGGKGYSVGPEIADDRWSFYTNDGWYDDVSDGPVEAIIRFPDGARVEAEPAWVVIAPPDFAPGILGIVTLYDVLRQVGIDHFGLRVPSEPSFKEDIYPLLKRATDLRWVNKIETWRLISTDYAMLSNRATRQEARKEAADVFQRIPLVNVKLRPFQEEFLQKWQAGQFKSDWSATPASSNAITAEGLTRAALEACVGQGFFPGIEAGIIVTEPSLYSRPFDFRFSPTALSPGDVTALMAQPWQADFWDCAGAWWPSQRPDIARKLPGAAEEAWARGINNHQEMVLHVNKLGVLVPPDYIEEGRQPEPWPT